MSHSFKVIKYLVCSLNHKEYTKEISANRKFSTLFPYYSFSRKSKRVLFESVSLALCPMLKDSSFCICKNP